MPTGNIGRVEPRMIPGIIGQSTESCGQWGAFSLVREQVVCGHD